DLQPLIEIKLVDREYDVDRREHRKIAKLVDEGIPVAVLQGVVKLGVPLVDQHRDGHDRQFDSDHRCEQDAAGPAIVRTEIRAGNSPNDGERRENTSHGWSPIAAVCDAGRKMKLTMIRRMDGEARNRAANDGKPMA